MILVTEDVWGPAFEELAKSNPTTQDPDLWNKKEQLFNSISQATALVVRNRTQVTEELIVAAPRLKIIARAGVGLDNIDVSAANKHGVVVVAGLGANATSVGELTVGLALSLLRNIPHADYETKIGKWNRKAGRELSGLTWGLLGCGATGLATAQILSGFGVSLVGFDPFVKANDARLTGLKIWLSSLDDVLKAADIISIHMPATKETQGLLNALRFSQMKPGAFLVSVGRGEVINESDLIDALNSGHISGAALDVRASEPPTIGELEKLPNVILTPHIAGITRESQSKINKILVDNISLVLNGKSATHPVGAIRESLR